MPVRTAGTSRRKTAKKRRIPHTHQPDNLDLHEWQIALRRQYAGERRFKSKNLGSDPVFSEFAVTNPESGKTYRVAIRGDQLGVNYCSCPDYAVNTLGTCKHIEWTLRRVRRGHAGVLRAGYVPPFAEVYVRYGLKRAVVFSPGSQCHDDLLTLSKRYFDPNGCLRRDSFAKFDQFLRKAAKVDQQLRVYDDAKALIAEVRDQEARRKRLKATYGGTNGAKAWRQLLKAQLFPYQRQGAIFAAEAGRCVIADDMGLGKTIEAMAAAEMLAKACGVERVLVVCPASLKGQWQHEVARFSPRRATVIEGFMHQRKNLYEKDEAFFKIVNYDVIHRDLDAISTWSPDLVILDEAQRIKNWETRTAKSVKQIQSPYAIVLTGTPLENRLDELHSIVEFVDRHRLGPLFSFKAAHEVHERGSTRVVGYRNLDRISKTLKPILIRRTKKEVLSQLPPRMDKNFFVPMTKQQWVPHRENQEIVVRIVAKWRRYKFLTEADQLRLRIALQYMRMACDSTYLVDHQTRHETKVGELSQLLEEIFENRDSKVIIFSQWLRMNELVADMLESRRWGYVHLHGGVPSKERKHLTRALREDKDCRVFLSTDAGGLGLNLQAASTVINMDLPWNPAVLEQRIGRAHRIGQKNPVRVVNFISEKTIEHSMLSLLSFKKSMFAGVLDGSSNEVMMGDGALNRFMKTVETATSNLPDGKPAPAPAPKPEAPPRSPTPGGAESKPSDVSGDGFNAAAVGQLLTAGAEFLQTLGRTLSQTPGSTPRSHSSALSPRLDTDTKTGRQELRLPLPDEQTLQRWIGQLGNVLEAISGRE